MVSDLSLALTDSLLDLPVWAAALPLWLGVQWLWITVGLGVPLRVWQGGATGRPAARAEPNLEFLARARLRR